MISRSTLYSAPGGDTVQITETAIALKNLNIDIDIRLADEKIDYLKYDLIHFFNVIRPNTIIPHIKKSNLPFVISTIFVDYSEVEQHFKGKIAQSLFKIFGLNGMEYIKTIARSIKNNETLLDLNYLIRGHKKSVEYVLKGAKLLLPNSNNEYKRLQLAYNFKTPYSVVPNAVNDDFLIRESHQQKRAGVICVARIEPIKNQLNLIKAINKTNLTLKLIGKHAPNHIKYFEECKKVAGKNVEFLGQQPKKVVIEELQKAKVHVLPSWFETTGLSSIEAAALGCNIVITDKGDTKEYFESMAEYCDPNNVISIKEAIEKSVSLIQNIELRQKIEKNTDGQLPLILQKKHTLNLSNLN